ncbi:MAG TPA: hypothetical protein PKE03_10270 [Bacteroidales bacterium]|mgnify:CR=1 FL=1|nr:hypothetical protein [Bacteroidales bacterium]
MAALKTVKLLKGQTLIIDFIYFEVKQDCDLVIKGVDISHIYPHNDFICVADYFIQCPAIINNKQVQACKRGYSTEMYKHADSLEPIACISTFTDIGGHYISVAYNGNLNTVAFLSNGFGDGRYTLRFINGYHIR